MLALPAWTIHHDTSIAAMMGQRNVFKGNDYHAGWTSHQFKTALMMGAVVIGDVETRCQLPWRVPVEGDVLRMEDASLAQLQVQTSTIVRPANVLVSYDIAGRCENPPECREDH